MYSSIKVTCSSNVSCYCTDWLSLDISSSFSFRLLFTKMNISYGPLKYPLLPYVGDVGICCLSVKGKCTPTLFFHFCFGSSCMCIIACRCFWLHPMFFSLQVFIQKTMTQLWPIAARLCGTPLETVCHTRSMTFQSSLWKMTMTLRSYARYCYSVTVYVYSKVCVFIS